MSESATKNSSDLTVMGAHATEPSREPWIRDYCAAVSVEAALVSAAVSVAAL